MIERYRDNPASKPDPWYARGYRGLGLITIHNRQTHAFRARLVTEKHRAKLARNGEDTH